MIAPIPPPQISIAELMWRNFWSLVVLVIEIYFFANSVSILGHIITTIGALLASGFLGRDLYYRRRG